MRSKPRTASKSRRLADAIDPSKELSNVGEALHTGDESGEKRLALLRRQAALGDLRDELALRARRDRAEE
jgi:hypothetical protein